MFEGWTIRPAIKYLPAIIAVGILLGIAVYAIGFREELGKAIVLHTVTSLCIGFPLLLLATNTTRVGPTLSKEQRMILLGLLFALTGVLASEIERVVETFVFEGGRFHFFDGGGVYLFNAILSIILGFSMMSPLLIGTSEPVVQQEPETEDELDTIPIKIGASIHLLPVSSIHLLEAADKYAYVYDEAGEKHLCDYSLAFLENRLPSFFSRIHRRYIVNVKQIARIQPFDKKRYVIDFHSRQIPPIKSSAGYQHVVRKLIKI